MEKRIKTIRAAIERFGPTIIFIAGGFIAFFTFSRVELKSLIINSESSILSISITLGGFLLTIYTLLGSVDNSVIKALKSGNSYILLIRYLNKAVKSNFTLVVFVLVIILIRSTDLSFQNYSDLVVKGLGSIYIGYILLAITQSFRIVYLITRILSYSGR